MNWPALALVVLLAGSVAPGRVATDYIRINVEPDFQYRTDQDVVIPVQVRAVRGGVPLADQVRLELRDDQGRLWPVPGGQEGLQDGVAPYPNVVYVNLGRLEPGLYRVTFNVTMGTLARIWVTEFDVVYPPQPYEATLQGTSGKAAKFIFRAHDEANFTVTVYRDGPSGRLVLERVTANRTVLEIPYIPGEGVKVDVEDQHGWRNAGNRFRDWHTGHVTYPPYIWNPDYGQIKNYEYRSWHEALYSGAILAALLVLYFFAVRRRRV